MSTMKVKKSLLESPVQNFEEDTKYNKELSIHSAAWLIPHDEKKIYGGEDTYFISENGNIFGVFDGVGGWSSVGVNPRDYSYSLMKYCKSTADKQIMAHTHSEKTNNNGQNDILINKHNEAESIIHNSNKLIPFNVLNSGYHETIKRRVVGSCTAIIAAISRQDTALCLDAINVGDSGLMVVNAKRNGDNQIDYQTVLRTKEQQHKFNMPFQLGTESNDLPSHGTRYSHNLFPGDIIILGTDGLWDNTYEKDILKILKDNTNATPQQLARHIAEATYQFSIQEDRVTPFAANAQKAFGKRSYVGGKEDDITVLVVKVGETERAKL